jgi:putative oxidoreductase
MTIDEPETKHSADAVLLPIAGRVLMTAIFVLSGLAKAAAPAATIGYIQSVGLPLPQIAFAGAIVVELAGGLLLLLGYKTRAAAAALAAFSILTAAFFHSALADQNQFIHFFKNVAIAGGLLQVVAFGGGRLSLDWRFLRVA